MKDWLAKFKSRPLLPWLALFAVCALAALLSRAAPATGGMTAEETRISRTLQSIAGAGETRVTIYYAPATASLTGGNGKTPVGAVVVARGAGDLTVRLRLRQAAETLLGLKPEQLEVFSMEDGS